MPIAVAFCEVAIGVAAGHRLESGVGGDGSGHRGKQQRQGGDCGAEAERAGLGQAERAEANGSGVELALVRPPGCKCLSHNALNSHT